MNFYEDEKQSQQEIYSPTPEIKIKKWYQKICTACIHYSRDYGEYDNEGWAICDENQKLGNMKSFPKCNAKSCKKFSAKGILNKESDWWSLIGGMTDMNLPEDLDGKIAFSILDFNERMGDYKVGRIE